MRAALALCLLCLARPALAADGGQLFADQCASCHSVAAASAATGPSLKGVLWRKVATREDFIYSPALKTLGGSWSPSRLDVFLKDSQALAPGTTMYVVVEDQIDRKAIVTYLKSAR